MARKQPWNDTLQSISAVRGRRGYSNKHHDETVKDPFSIIDLTSIYKHQSGMLSVWCSGGMSLLFRGLCVWGGWERDFQVRVNAASHNLLVVCILVKRWPLTTWVDWFSDSVQQAPLTLVGRFIPLGRLTSRSSVVVKNVVYYVSTRICLTAILYGAYLLKIIFIIPIHGEV